MAAAAKKKRNVVRGEVNVDFGNGVTGSVDAAQVAPLEKIMALANKIWGDVRRSGVSPDDVKQSDTLLSTLRSKNQDYKDFATSYPIPFRWMVQAREYEPKAFEKFLKRHVKMMYKDRKEFMEAQGEYLVLMYKIHHPRAAVRQVARYRTAVFKSLDDDDKNFAKAREEADEEVKRLDAENDAERRRRIAQYLIRLKESAAGGAAGAAADAPEVTGAAGGVETAAVADAAADEFETADASDTAGADKVETVA